MRFSSLSLFITLPSGDLQPQFCLASQPADVIPSPFKNFENADVTYYCDSDSGGRRFSQSCGVQSHDREKGAGPMMFWNSPWDLLIAEAPPSLTRLCVLGLPHLDFGRGRPAV